MRKIYSYLLAVMAAAVLAIPAMAQQITVSGQVTDATDGQPLIGVGVMLPGGTGTVTDYDGQYVIQAPKNATLTFSSLGYDNVTVAIDGRTVINVTMNPDTQSLEEVVVLGYTSQKKAELSSAVVSMSGEKLRDVASSDVGNMLQGKVAGVVVMNSSGQPGASADIRIRGTGSITASSGPLYVVDGVAGGSFNPNDIETITVLKDASATALYGAAASGGVIVVTTKSGSGDKTEINFKASGGIKKALMGRFHAMNAEELYDYESTMFNPKLFAQRYPETLKTQNFDWVNNCFKLGVVQNYYASVSGKANRVNYFASIDHYNEKGTLINTNYRKTSARLNLSAPITDRLTMHAKVSYSRSYDQGTSSWRLLEYSYYAMPWDIPYVMAQDEDGNWNQTKEIIYITDDKTPRSDNGAKWWTQNPSNVLHSEQYNYSKGHSEALVGDLQLVWNVTDWLTLTSTNRFDTSNYYYEGYVDPRTYDGAATGGELSNSNGEWNSWGTTNMAKFHKTFGDHDVNAIIGWEYGSGYSRSMGASGTSFPAGQRALSNTVMSKISGSDYNTRTWALLGQAQYSYLGKYVATASIRYDESYKFGPLNRGGYFPGVSAAWIISKENFMRNSFLTFLKLRAGYGKTGNDNIPAFQYQDTFALTALYNGKTAAVLTRQANYNLGWEEAYMASVGIDATILNNWNITVDLYNTINSRILLEAPLAPSSGFFGRYENVGKVRNRGIELAVDGAIFNNKDFGWTVGLNLGLNQNRVLELPNHEDMVMSPQILSEGRDVYSWYMPKWMGIDPETGGPLWETYVPELDENGLPTYYIDENGKAQAKMVASTTSNYTDATFQVVGSASPWFSGGLNTVIRFKGFTLSATGSFVVGNKIYNQAREHMDSDGGYTNLNQMSINNGLGWSRAIDVTSINDAIDKAIKDGKSEAYIQGLKDEKEAAIAHNRTATHPYAIGGRTDSTNKLSSRFLEDGSFFRLRNVTLSYDLPEKLISKIKMSGARVYISGDNLLTISKFSGMDPEVSLSDVGSAGVCAENYPVPLSVVLGVEIKF
ncbi:MAG: TonB-dependent receptor [Bacteroidales bacterium]|nr:TonB-dependent receptor [Bacteroidales bacterium]